MSPCLCALVLLGVQLACVSAFSTGAGACLSTRDEMNDFVFHHGAPMDASGTPYSLQLLQDTYIPGCKYYGSICGADQLKGYLGLSHPDPSTAEKWASAVYQNLLPDLWPHLKKGKKEAPEVVHDAQEEAGNTGRCKYIDYSDEEPSEGFQSDEEDWYGERGATEVLEKKK